MSHILIKLVNWDDLLKKYIKIEKAEKICENMKREITLQTKEFEVQKSELLMV